MGLGAVFWARFQRLGGRVVRRGGIGQPRPPPTTGKVERFHRTLQRGLLNDAVPFDDLSAAPTTGAGWVVGYNILRPHQSLGMACPEPLWRPFVCRVSVRLVSASVDGFEVDVQVEWLRCGDAVVVDAGRYVSPGRVVQLVGIDRERGGGLVGFHSPVVPDPGSCVEGRLHPAVLALGRR
ncbi:hypothetical protein DMH08_15485 [Actinomadura sp. WAC 06369]|nr:hypothetical protein DMH08_15485 [Actinomadura sp. WAC 06369]